MLNQMGLGFVFTARDLASGAIRRLDRNFKTLDQRVGLGAERMQSAFQQLTVGLAVFTAGLATVAVSLSLADAAGEFEQGIAAVGAVARAEGRQLDLLRDSAIQAGIATQFSPEEAVAGLQSLATAGQTATQATQTLIPVLDLAAGSLGQLGVAQSAEAVVGTLNAYGMAANEAAGVTDRLLRVTQLTNFQTRDFEVGLSKAAATGAVFGQSLDDVLIGMGLLRNRNIDASSSATAFREAVRRVGAETRATQAITSAGVEVFDEQSGKMRSVIDIMSDFARATASMAEDERNRRVVTAFGARGLLAFNAVLNASFTTMRGGQQVTLLGAEAIETMRKEMEAAGGTATQFREKLLDTYEGQKTLLKGTMQTYAVALGEPFAKIFKPIVSAVVSALNFLLQAFQAIPAPIKQLFAGLVVGAGAIVTLVGGVLMAKGAMALMVIALKAAGITLGGVLALLWPAVLAVGALALVVAGFAIAFKKNVGGIADFVQGVGERVSLAFRAISQLFQQGGFSGALRDELNRAENQGIKSFVINLFLWANRIKHFFMGIASGFSAGIEAAGPSIEAFLGTLRRVGVALGVLSEHDDATTASQRFQQFGLVGQQVGGLLANAFELVVRGMTMVASVAQGVAEGWSLIRPGVDVLVRALAQLGAKLGEAFRHLFRASSATQQHADGWTTLGTVVSFVVGVVASVLGVFVSVISLAVSIASGAIGMVMAWFSGLADVITGVVFIIGGLFTGSWTDVWTGMKLVAFGVVDAIIGVVLELAGIVAGVVDSLSSLFGEGTKWQQGVRDFRESLRTDMAQGMGVENLTFTKPPASDSGASAPRQLPPPGGGPPAPALAYAPAAMPAAAATAAQLQLPPVTLQAPPAPPPPPVTVNVQVDGQTIATAVAKADRDNATRSFSPVPSY